MSFAVRNLSVLAYANGFTLWHYKSGTDPLARASAKGYFADAADLMAPGDMVMLSGADGCEVNIENGRAHGERILRSLCSASRLISCR